MRFTVESKPFGIDLDMVESDGDIYVVKVGAVDALVHEPQDQCALFRVFQEYWTYWNLFISV